MDPLLKKSFYSENFQTSTDTEPQVANTGFSMMASLFLCHDQEVVKTPPRMGGQARAGLQVWRDSRSCGSDWTPSGKEKWAEGGNNTWIATPMICEGNIHRHI